MTKDDIIRMAREAGLFVHKEVQPEIELFAALVAAKASTAEREACAAICDRFQARDVGMQPAECAAAIRARGELK